MTANTLSHAPRPSPVKHWVCPAERVRRDDDVERQQRVVRVDRLPLEHVEPGARDAPVPQRASSARPGRRPRGRGSRGRRSASSTSLRASTRWWVCSFSGRGRRRSRTPQRVVVPMAPPPSAAASAGATTGSTARSRRSSGRASRAEFPGRCCRRPMMAQGRGPRNPCTRSLSAHRPSQWTLREQPVREREHERQRGGCDGTPHHVSGVTVTTMPACVQASSGTLS